MILPFIAPAINRFLDERNSRAEIITKKAPSSPHSIETETSHLLFSLSVNVRNVSSPPSNLTTTPHPLYAPARCTRFPPRPLLLRSPHRPRSTAEIVGLEGVRLRIRITHPPREPGCLFLRSGIRRSEARRRPCISPICSRRSPRSPVYQTFGPPHPPPGLTSPRRPGRRIRLKEVVCCNCKARSEKRHTE